MKTVGPEIDKNDVGFVVRLESPLRKRVSTQLLALHEDGTYRRIPCQVELRRRVREEALTSMTVTIGSAAVHRQEPDIWKRGDFDHLNNGNARRDRIVLNERLNV